MRGVWRTLVLATAACGAAVALYVALTLPPKVIHLPATLAPTVVSGAYHIHTTRSDGTGSVDDVAAAAARAGLRFVILTDHGDATRPPDPPTYRHGVLCLDAVEVSTAGGHLVALGLDGPSPYPLGGAPRDVIEDVHRLGGAAIAAHPDSPKPDLRWRGPGNGFDGIEWLNADSEWRDETPSRLLVAAVRSLARPAETLVSLFSRPVRTLQRWDTAARTRRVFGLAAVDAHARIGWDETEEPRERTLARWPSYLTMFRSVTQSVVLDAPLSGDASADARRLLEAIRQARSYSVVGGIASPGVLEFSATQAGLPVIMGADLPQPGSPVTFHVAVPGAPGARIALIQNGREVATATGTLEYAGVSSPGAYRAEVYLGTNPVPWLASNPIFSRLPVPPRAPDSTMPHSTSQVVAFGAEAPWVIERDPTSDGRIDRTGSSLGLVYRLGPGAPAGQYAALSMPVEAAAGFDRVLLTVRATSPMRFSVQLRLPGGRDGQRWRRSVYADLTPRAVVIPLQEFEPVDSSTTQQPLVARVRALLFVVDTVNSAPGASGEIWLSDVSLGVGNPGG